MLPIVRRHHVEQPPSHCNPHTACYSHCTDGWRQQRREASRGFPLSFSCVLRFHFNFYCSWAVAGCLSWVFRPLGLLHATVVCARVRVASEFAFPAQRIGVESTGQLYPPPQDRLHSLSDSGARLQQGCTLVWSN